MALRQALFFVAVMVVVDVRASEAQCWYSVSPSTVSVATPRRLPTTRAAFPTRSASRRASIGQKEDAANACLIPRAVRHLAYRHHQSTLVGWRQLREAQEAAMTELVRVVSLVVLFAIPSCSFTGVFSSTRISWR